MSHYRDPPDEPKTNPIVVATPEEVHALAPAIAGYLRRRRIPEREIPDLVQHVAIVTCAALNEGRVRGPRWRSADDSLCAFMFEVAWKTRQNHVSLARVRLEVLEAEPENEAEAAGMLRDPIGQFEAREILARLTARPEVLAFLLAMQDSPPKPSEKLRAGKYIRAARIRRWLRKVVESGKWREPPQPTPPTPRHRKGKR